MTSILLGVILRQCLWFSCWWYPLLFQSNIFHGIFKLSQVIIHYLSIWTNTTLLPRLSSKFSIIHLWTVKYIVFDWLIDWFSFDTPTLLHLMHAIGRLHSSTLSTSLVRVKNRTCQHCFMTLIFWYTGIHKMKER